jgi:hypothetical protein
VLVCVVLVGCGRLGFDDVPDGGGIIVGPDGPCAWSSFSTPARLPGGANTVSDEWMGAPTLGGTELYFHSYRGNNSDLYRSTRASVTDDFSAATEVVELSTGEDQWSPTLSEDGLSIIYADATSGQYHLFEATRSSPGSTFVPSGAIPNVNASPGVQDNHPWLSADGLRLLFMSNRMNTDRVFETTRPDRASEFAMPVPLDLGGNAGNPTLSADGLELFFSSTRGGSQDIWTAKRPAIGQPFGTPTVVMELSSSRDDCCMRLSRDGTTIFLNYDTLTAGGGAADLFSATRTCN